MNRKTKKSENTGNGYSIWHIVIAIAYIICTGFVYYTTSSNTSYDFRLTYGDNPSTTAQLYYDTGESFVETQSIKVDFTEQQAVFVLNDTIRENSISYRIDPLCTEQESATLSLRSFSIIRDNKDIKTYQGKDFLKLIASTNDIGEIKITGGDLILPVTGSDPYWIFKEDFASSVSEAVRAYNRTCFIGYLILLSIIAILSGILLYYRKALLYFIQERLEPVLKQGWFQKFHAFLTKTIFKQEEKLSLIRKVTYLLSLIFFGTAVILFTLGKFLLENFNGLSMEEIVFHLKVPMTGTGTDMITKYFASAKTNLIIGGIVLIVIIFLLASRKNIRNLHLTNNLALLISFCLLVTNLLSLSRDLHLSEYISNQMSSSTFIEDNYVSPRDTSISFPEKKRNLIYIYLESMESTFISKEEGGCMSENLIPELTKLAQDNINFSESEQIGGATSSSGTQWTVGAMVAQTSGLPLLIPIEANSYGEYAEFLPGATSLGEILENNGYAQEIMVGSDLSFGGRRNYFTQHGNYQVYDLFTGRAREDLPDDYYVWWGFEDSKLFSYAKEEITKLAQGNKPFNFTMLTADTHHIGGFLCELCQNKHESQYENVLSCSSRQVAAFVDWIKNQDFYDNTTIIISGDHPTMDSQYIDAHYDNSKPRKVYNCFINAVGDAAHSKNRDFIYL